MIRRNPDVWAVGLLLLVLAVASAGRRAVDYALAATPALQRIGVLSKHLEAETDDLAERVERRVERQVEQIDRRVNEQVERLQKKLTDRIADRLGKMGRVVQ